jgi:hypothetical protein
MRSPTVNEPANVETQVVGELERRRAEEAAAIAELAEMTVAEMDEAVLRPCPAEDLRQEAKERSGRRRPRPEDVEAAAEQLPEEQRQAVTEAVEAATTEETPR